MNQQESSLNERILKLLDDNLYMDYVVNIEPKLQGKYETVDAIERLVLQEQLELLKNSYYGEDLKDDDILDHYKRVLETAKEHFENQLNELKP